MSIHYNLLNQNQIDNNMNIKEFFSNENSIISPLSPVCHPFSGPLTDDCICTKGWGAPIDTLYSDGFPSDKNIKKVNNYHCVKDRHKKKLFCDPFIGPPSENCFCSKGWRDRPNEILYTDGLPKSTKFGNVVKVDCSERPECHPIKGPSNENCFCTKGWKSNPEMVFFSEGIPLQKNKKVIRVKCNNDKKM